MDYQDALDVAMHREKAAFALYTDLAGATDDPELQELFTALAQEEAKHKLFLEREYDEHVLTDN
jgi:rubrerythrin